MQCVEGATSLFGGGGGAMEVAPFMEKRDSHQIKK